MNVLRITSTVAALILAGSLAHAAPDGKKIAHITLALQNPFVATVAKTIEETGKADGMSVSTFSGPFDAALQSQQIDDAIAQKFDAIALFPADPNALLPALARAKAANIPVFLVNSRIAEGHDDLYVSAVGENETTLGQLAGEQAVAAIGDRPAKAAIVSGTLSESTPQERIAGFKAALAKAPNIELVAVEDANWDMAKSEQIAGQLFARFGADGGVDVIFAMADYMAMGVIQAAKAANIPLGTGKGELAVVAGNCGKMGLDAIKAGEQVSTGTQMPARTGRAAVGLMVDYFNGKSLEKRIVLPMVAITKANADEYMTDCTY